MYTLYWRTKNEPLTKEEFVECVEAIEQLVEDYKNIVVLEYKVDKYNIAFNGIGDDAHETFTFYSDFADTNQERIINSLEGTADLSEFKSGVLDFNFCKTARKPYDKVVKLALMKVQEITGNKLDVSCDDGLKYYADKIVKETDLGAWE